MEENHSMDAMRKGMPYAFSLAKQYGYATNYYAITHPSLPNYVAIATGSTHTISDDASPAANGFNGTSVFDQAIANGKTAMIFSDGMPTNCTLNDGGDEYYVKHNPWAYVTNHRANCNNFDVPMTQFSTAVSNGTLPNAGMVVPNICNDAHDCSLGTADRWFESQMKKVFSGPDWKSGKLLVVLTADEDDKHNNNNVLTIVMSPSLHSQVKSCKLTHYSLSALYSKIVGAKPLGNAATAPSFAACFDLSI